MNLLMHVIIIFNLILHSGDNSANSRQKHEMELLSFTVVNFIKFFRGIFFYSFGFFGDFCPAILKLLKLIGFFKEQPFSL